MKKWLKRFWFEQVILPYLMKHGPECCAHMRDTIVYQMWYAGIGFAHINKWLAVMHEPSIKAYVMEGKNRDKLRVFFELPSMEQRAAITGNVVLIK